MGCQRLTDQLARSTYYWLTTNPCHVLKQLVHKPHNITQERLSEEKSCSMSTTLFISEASLYKSRETATYTGLRSVTDTRFFLNEYLNILLEIPEILYKIKHLVFRPELLFHSDNLLSLLNFATSSCRTNWGQKLKVKIIFSPSGGTSPLPQLPAMSGLVPLLSWKPQDGG